MIKKISIIGLVLIFSGCAGSKSVQQDSSVTEKQVTVTTNVVSYFTGDGGKGKSLGVGVPKSQGLNENQVYLPTLVQGVLVDSIKKYSAISVVDRVSLDRVIEETLDPTFEDNMDIVRLGHVAQVGNWLTGNIIRTSTGYTLLINVTDTTPNVITVASFTGTSAVAEFDDHSAIRRASLAILEQMGVELTSEAKNELNQASTPQYVNAQTALSQGIIAQQKGTVVEALSYFYSAASFDSNLSEATGRLSTLSSNISSGNIGENVRNDIQRRNEWIKILKEAEEYFLRHPPFEIEYSLSLTQGRIDYTRETVDISFPMTLKPTEGFKIVQNILNGLKSTGKQEEWGLKWWPLNSRVFKDRTETDPSWGTKTFIVNVSLLNEHGKILSNVNASLPLTIGFYSPHGMSTYAGYGGIRDFSRIYIGEPQPQSVRFHGVNANEVTDNLTIKIVSVDGVDITENTGYIKITSR